MSVRGLSALIALAMAVRAAECAGPRFPTEDHKKFPLAEVHETADGGTKVRLIPFKEPGFVRAFEERWKQFTKAKLPLHEAPGDTVRYFFGISHGHGTIPRGHREAAAPGIGTAYLHRFVFDAKGRVKIVHGVKKDGTKRLSTCVLYDEERRTAFVGRFHDGRLSWSLIAQYAVGGDAWDLEVAPVRIVRLDRDGRVRSYEEFEGGRRMRSVHLPDLTPLKPGKWPCQARRYHYELKALLTAPGLTDEERVRAILRYTKYEPVANEERWRGGYGYATLRDCAVRSLGQLRTKPAQRALVGLLNDRRLRAAAAMNLGKSGDRTVLPSLLKALEQEDTEAQGRPFRFAERNRHLVTGHIVRAMLQLAPDKAKPMLKAFLNEKQRVFRTTVERGLQ